MLEFYEEEQVAKAVAVMLKVGSLFRVGKTTTGCNMEGFGAGSAATSAGIVELMGGSPSQLEKAMVLSISPTIANPCTPRVMVAGLCATHIAGAIHIGNLSGYGSPGPSFISKTYCPGSD
jgi:L-serine dehydratase